jgi:hypothetical protein
VLRAAAEATENVAADLIYGARRSWLALRTRRGLPLDALPTSKSADVDALVRARLAAKLRDRLVLTARGMDVYSAVVERLLP